MVVITQHRIMYTIRDFLKISFIITEQNYRTIIKRTNEVLKHRVQYFLLTNEYVLLYILLYFNI